MSPRVGSCTETCFSTVVAGAVTADDGNRSFTQFADIVYGKRRLRGMMRGVYGRMTWILADLARNLLRSRRLETISWREATVLSSDSNPTVWNNMRAQVLQRMYGL